MTADSIDAAELAVLPRTKGLTIEQLVAKFEAEALPTQPVGHKANRQARRKAARA